MIHVIGDSHSVGFTTPYYTEMGREPPVPDLEKRFTVHVAGPRTAHQLLNHMDVVQPGLDAAGSNPILFCFGEIDCRWHINDLAGVKATVERYIELIHELRGVWNIRPMTVVPAATANGPNDDPFEDMQRRNALNMEFNDQLTIEARDLGVPTVNVWDWLITGIGGLRGVRDESLDRDHVHIFYPKELIESVERQMR